MAFQQPPSHPGGTPFQSWRAGDPVDEMLARYIEWRVDARCVAEAYERWRQALAADTDWRFATYLAALDHEEASAGRYATAVAEVVSSLDTGEFR